MGEPGGQAEFGAGAALRVGVVGLGRGWRRHYGPALRALRGRFELTAVCDQLAVRARLTARRLRCAAAAGPTELLERPDVDALLLLDPQWYGLWPLEAACRLGKPVFCGVTPVVEETHADRVHQAVQQSQLPVMVGLAAPFSATLGRLRELLTTQLGTPRLLLGTLSVPDRTKHRAASPLPPGLTPLLSWCALLLEGEPRRVLFAGSEGDSLASVLLDYGDGRLAQLTRVRTPAGRRSWRVQVAAEHGNAVAAPGQVRWRGSEGRFSHSPGRQHPTARVLLEAFRQALAEGRPPRPSLADAHRLLGWLRLAARSRAEGRWAAPG